jgi:hypothetical protein
MQQPDWTGVHTVSDMLCQSDSRIVHSVTNMLGHRHSWGKFDNLLMPALNGAVTLKQMNNIAMLVGEDLHLDVLWAGQEFLQEDGIHTKRVLGLLPCFAENDINIGAVLLVDYALSAATTAVGRLDYHGESVPRIVSARKQTHVTVPHVLCNEALHLPSFRDWIIETGDGWNRALVSQFPGRYLVPEAIKDVSRRSND